LGYREGMAPRLGIHAYRKMVAAAREVSRRALDRLHALHQRFPAEVPDVRAELLATVPPAPGAGSERVPGSERRGVPRRTGPWLRAAVSEIDTPEQTVMSWVCDQSPRGVGLWLPRRMAVGSVLYLSPLDVPEGTPCSLVEVRHLRPWEDGWAVGCRFIRLAAAQAPLFGG
jgi:hypothetical protein